jgi:putative chitinase|tara:strand:+ start:1463 stop:2077 length:615 start_codon:yes stop_codon:yes gene_type:complete
MSDALKLLQTKCGCSPDGSFGPNTARGIVKHYELSPERGAHFLGQVVHESASFKLTKENLNYSVEAMMRVWPSRFPTEESAKPYSKNPKALADKVYSGRMGNKEGEGHKWIGRGFLQLTGFNNVRSFASDMRLPEVMEDPTLLEKEYAMETALWFFRKNNLWKICDEGVSDDVIKKLTKRINGGYTGLDHRIKETNKIYEWIKV